jgi:aminocarboxymuconate-semialdehyde decarboxylase
MIIDAYSHVCPAPLLEAITAAKPSAEAGALTNSYLWDAGRRLRYMDKVGIDLQVLTLVRPPMWLGMDRKDIHRLTRLANETIAEFAADHPDRFAGVGVMPVVDDETMAEFRRARDELGLKGVLIFTNVEGLPLDDDSMWQLYDEAAASGTPIWIHPQHGRSHAWLQRDLVDRVFGWPFETSVAMARLVYGGVLDRYPDLTFITHHCGGMVPFFAERIAGADHAAAPAVPGEAPAAPRDNVIEQLKRFYGDAMVGGSVSALRCGLDFFGPEHVVYGTDFPMGGSDGESGPVKVLNSIRELDVSDADRELILSGTMRRLLGL